MAHDFDALLRLHPCGDDVFENEPQRPGHLYGGWTMALALRAATRTVDPELRPRSLHAVFPAAGDAGTALRLEVARWRDSRSNAIRQVVVRQGHAVPLVLTATFAPTASDGTDWQEEPAAALPSPEEVAADRSLLVGVDPVEFRTIGPDRVDDGGAVLRRLHPFWARPWLPLADDPAVHACVLTYVSDYMMVAASQVPGTTPAPGSMVASLDHAVWFHRPVQADDWLLYRASPASVTSGRGFSRGTVHTRDGRLVASFGQESLTFRPRG